MPKAPTTPRRKTLVFARNFVRHPGMLGSVLPSSRFLVRRLLGNVRWGEAGVVVEYGPGVGSFTVEILDRLRADATLVAFETNRDFVRYLRDRVRDPRLQVVHGSAHEVETGLTELGHEAADYVICGLPFTWMPNGIRDAILEATRLVLRPGGEFLVYQFSPALQPHLKRVFGRVEWRYEPRNLLPAFMFRCRA